MTILTVKCDPSDYIRVIAAADTASAIKHIGRVGRLMSKGQNERDPEEMFFVMLHGLKELRVFSAKQVEYITEKEYFKGCLSG
jgi:hypothetical protein